MLALFVNGASVSVFDSGGRQSTICATDSVSARAESLQFELGEGPHWEALRSGRPVLSPDIRASSAPLWPMFSQAAVGLGIGAVFAFPMKIGAAVVGVVDLYCLAPRRLDSHQVSLASSMANRIAADAVRIATNSANDAVATEHPMAPALRREVHQATGMIQVQLNVTATEAFTRLRGRAFSTSTPIERLAKDVVAGLVNFSSLPD